MPRFRKKPIMIDAIQYDGSNGSSLYSWSSGRVIQSPVLEGQPCVQVQTMEGMMTGAVGDWIIRGIMGEFYPCKPDIFAATYDPVEDDNA